MNYEYVIGGEVPGAFIFSSEHVRTDRVGFACGLVMSGICTGILLRALSATVLNTTISKEEMASWGWRLPFVAGGIAGFVAVYLRCFLQETPVFESIKTNTTSLSDLPLKVVVRGHLSTVLVSALA
jgi:MFS family permease